jgi:hypothetical protein
MENLQRMLGMGMGRQAAAGPPSDTPQVDTAEQIYISSLALLKMLKHGQSALGLFGRGGVKRGPSIRDGSFPCSHDCSLDALSCAP